MDSDADLHALLETARSRTRALLLEAAAAFGIAVPRVEIRFDLRGQAAGQVRWPPRGPAVIRYNRLLLQENGERFLARTLPHEVAHVLARQLHGPGIRPHGPEWKALMARFGAEASRCHDFDTDRARTRRLARHTYHCACREHALSSIRHNRVLRGQRYLCRLCGEPLRPGGRPQTR